MTAILGYADGTNVWMAGDSAVLNGWTHYTLKGRKVFPLFDDMLIGCAGQPRLAQLVRYGLSGSIHLQFKKDDPEAWLAMGFVPAVLAVCESGKFDWRHEDNNNSALLIGFHGTLYTLTSSGSLDANGNGICGLGAGADYAVGAFEGYWNSDGFLETALIRALEVAGKYSGAVLPPYYVERV